MGLLFPTGRFVDAEDFRPLPQPRATALIYIIYMDGSMSLRHSNRLDFIPSRQVQSLLRSVDSGDVHHLGRTREHPTIYDNLKAHHSRQ